MRSNGKYIKKNIALGEYYEEISNIYFQEETAKKMIRMMRAAPNDKAAYAIYQKYNDISWCGRFGFYEFKQKIEIIQKTIAGLIFFEIGYPTPPEIIKDLL